MGERVIEEAVGSEKYKNKQVNCLEWEAEQTDAWGTELN